MECSTISLYSSTKEKERLIHHLPDEETVLVKAVAIDSAPLAHHGVPEALDV